MSDFDTRELGDMVAVGATDATGVRLWLRTRAGAHDLEIWNATARHGGTIELAPPPGSDGTTSVRYPDDFPGAAPLAPVTAYAYRVRRGDAVVGVGRFETAPAGAADTPSRFSFAVTSCHQPFDEDGTLYPPSLKMLEALDRALRDHDVKRVFLMGDQMYADYPEKLSLFDDAHFATIAPPGRRRLLDCTRAEVRALYQRRYRAFWSIERFRELLASYPCHAILDDHELCDNFGSAPEHADGAWEAVRAGGLDAFDDYQGLLLHGRGAARPASFDYQVRYGDVGVYALDIRSQRRCRGDTTEICTPAQLDALEAYLAAADDLQVVLVIVSVPLAIFPSWVASLGARLVGQDSDAADRWSHPAAAASRHRLTSILHEQLRRRPAQRLIVLAGDIHIGCVVRLRWRDPGVPPIYQLVSSSVSNLLGPLVRKLGKVAAHLDGSDDELWACAELLAGTAGAATNPIDQLNVGIVECRRDGGGRLDVRLKLVSHDDGDPPSPRTVFVSEPL